MKCQFCDSVATIHLTDIANKKKREAHLCERCARERNLIPEAPGPQIDLKALVNLLAAPFQLPATSADADVEGCPSCGTTFAAFKAEGRFGCPNDYDAFRVPLEPLLERIHRGIMHNGKLPRTARRAVREVEIEDLRTQLRSAVKNEQYEDAARLRDLIRQKEAEAEGNAG